MNERTPSIEQYYQHQDNFYASVLAKYPDQPQTAVRNHARDGSIKLLDALALRDLLIEAKPKAVLEIGSFLGFSTKWILAATEGSQAKVTSLDPGIIHRIFDNVADHVREYCATYADRLSQKRAFLSFANYNLILAEVLREHNWQGDPVEILNALKSIPVITEPFAKFDFVFVDGDHTYKATILNVLHAAEMATDGATIVIHDAISWPQVEPALNDLCHASGGQLELVTISGKAPRRVLKPKYEASMTPQSAALAVNAISDGVGVVRVKSTVTNSAAILSKIIMPA
jgi:predicted O-methyltransferase YrrM